LNIATG